MALVSVAVVEMARGSDPNDNFKGTALAQKPSLRLTREAISLEFERSAVDSF